MVGYSGLLQSLFSYLSYSLFISSLTEGELSHLNFSTNSFSLCPLKNLCSFFVFAVFSLVSSATETASAKLYLFKIENFSCSVCGHPTQDTFHLILQCSATDSLHRSLFGDSLSLYDLWSRELPGFWDPKIFHLFRSLESGGVATTTSTVITVTYCWTSNFFSFQTTLFVIAEK